MKLKIFMIIIMLFSSVLYAFATDELLNGLIAKYKFENTDPLLDSINSYNLSKDSPAETTSGVIGYAINLNASSCSNTGYCPANYCFTGTDCSLECDIDDLCEDPYDCWTDEYGGMCTLAMDIGCYNPPYILPYYVDCGGYCFIESNYSCIMSNYNQVYSYDPAFKLDSEFTINAWIKKSASSDWLDQIVASGGWNNPDYYGYTFAVCTDPACPNGKLNTVIFDGDADFDVFTGGDDINLNEWLMATMVFSNSNNYIAVYMNGSLIYNYSVFSNPVYYTGDVFQTIMLGQANLASATSFYGYMDELAFINRTWSPKEVEWVYFSEVGGTAFELNSSLPEACVPNWSCDSFDSCEITNLRSCLTVYDNNICNVTFLGTLNAYSEECFLCNGEILINSTFNDASLNASGWINDSLAGGNPIIANSTFYNEINSGVARIYKNLSSWDMLNNSVIHEKIIRSSDTPAFASEIRLGYAVGGASMQFIVLSNTGNFTFFGLANTCTSSNLTDGQEFYLGGLDTNPHNIDYHFTDGIMYLYWDNEYKYSFPFSNCNVHEKIELTSRYIDEKTDEIIVCGSNIPDCVPDWSCNIYNSCNISDLTLCNETIDNNNCSVMYTGNYSEFGVFSCNYCSASVTSGSLICENNTGYQIFLNTNYAECCNMTDITADCVINGFDFRINNGTYIYIQPCVTPPQLSFNYAIIILVFIGALMLICGLYFNIPFFTFFSALVWFILASFPFIETPIIRIMIGILGGIVAITFGLSINKS